MATEQITSSIIHKAPANVPKLFYGNVADFMRQAPPQGDKKMFISAETGESLTTAQQWQTVELFASKLYQLGIGHSLRPNADAHLGDVVLLYVKNSIYVPAAHWALLDLGATVAPAAAVYKARDLVHQIKLVQPKLVVCDEALKGEAEEALKQLNAKTSVVTMEELRAPAKLKQRQRFRLSRPEAAKRVAALVMSSGTSGGLPKAVRVTHHVVTSNAQCSAVVAPDLFADSSNVISAVLPMSHIYGYFKFLFACFYTGETCVVHGEFNLRAVLQAQRTYGITSFFMVPPIIIQLAKAPEVDEFLPSLRKLRFITSGAAPLGGNVIEAVKQRIGAHVRVTQMYGMTESILSTCFNPSDEDVASRSVGKLCGNIEARIVAPDGTDQPAYPETDPDKIDAAFKRGDPLPSGELWLRGPAIMAGYHGNAGANAEAFVDAADAAHVPHYHKKWLRTGDVAVIDSRGRIVIVDRTKEMIKSMGKAVAPAELEALLLSHPQVIDAAVIGVHVPEKGTEAARAFVVLRDAQGCGRDVATWLNGQVPSYKRLHGGVVVLQGETIPKNASGKILRRLLRQRQGDNVVFAERARL
ncbi:putative 4-coumarate--CoA ligase 3 [Yarrowia sp. B02]|nr:putative 4-coumarate--CoA ligase 3 [Yarrowia sp. B02]